MDTTDSPSASGTSPGIWSLIRSYLTPTTLFLLLNLVIGTIAITSRAHRRHHHENSNQNQNQNQSQSQIQNQHPTPALTRNPSTVLDRLRSFSLYRFRSGDFPPEYNQSQIADPDVSDVGPTAHSQIQNQHPAPALTRNPSSVLDRLRSFSLYRFRSGDFPPEYNQSQIADPDVSDVGPTTYTHEEHHFGRSRSESEATQEKEKAAKKKEVVTQMKKSSSESKMPQVVERRAAAARPARVEEEHEVDARADDFINKFRQQLQLQRLNSLLNYKEMLNRGK